MPPVLPVFSPNFIMYCMGLASYVEPMFLQNNNQHDATITVIIPAYNEQEHIEKTINSLFDQTVQPEKIVVVDDGSIDETKRTVEKLGEIQILRNIHRKGKAESINRALDAVNTDLVMILDADTVLEETFIEKSKKTLSEKNIVAASGFVTPSKNSSNAAIRVARAVEDYYGQTTLKRGQTLMNGLFVVSGCCAVFKTSVLKEFYIPTETVTEDLDLTWMMELQGYRTGLIEAHAYTLEPKGLPEYVSQIKRWYMGFFQCLHKHGSKILSKKPLTFTVSLILVECLLFSILWAAILGIFFSSLWFNGELLHLRSFITLLLGVDLIIVCFPALIKACKKKALTEFLAGIPVYYSLRIVNTFVWWITLIEWAFGFYTPWKKSH
jgi:cellulose synthase/poly-beta-1,6-N-acetylglucosamine synthase-like glycosyltransferase